MKRSDVMNTYDEMMQAQDLRLEPRQGKAHGTRVERASALQLANSPTVDGSQPAVTLARVLRSFRGSAPSPQEHQRVQAMLWASAQDTHSAMETAREAYESACTVRAGLFTELVAGGESYATIGRMMGLSRAAVHKIVKEHAGKE